MSEKQTAVKPMPGRALRNLQILRISIWHLQGPTIIRVLRLNGSVITLNNSRCPDGEQLRKSTCLETSRLANRTDNFFQEQRGRQQRSPRPFLF